MRENNLKLPHFHAPAVVRRGILSICRRLFYIYAGFYTADFAIASAMKKVFKRAKPEILELNRKALEEGAKIK
jgi:diphthamide biosynthesis methyltransferase